MDYTVTSNISSDAKGNVTTTLFQHTQNTTENKAHGFFYSLRKILARLGV